MSENLMDRRDFMKTSVTGLGGFAVLASNEKKEEEKKQTGPKMIYRTLGKTGIKVPVIGMGAAAPPEVFQAALNAGVMFIDTSQAYGRGQHESMIGQIIKGRPRDSFVVSTKAWIMRDRVTGLFTQEDQGRRILKRRGREFEAIGSGICGSISYSRCLDESSVSFLNPL